MFRPKSKTNVFAAGLVTLTADRASCATTGGEVWPRRTPDGAVAVAAATQAESSKAPVFHPSGNFRASYLSMPWNSV